MSNHIKTPFLSWRNGPFYPLKLDTVRTEEGGRKLAPWRSIQEYSGGARVQTMKYALGVQFRLELVKINMLELMSIPNEISIDLKFIEKKHEET